MKSNCDRHAIAILGSTGTVGRATIEVVRDLGEPWRVVGLAAGNQAKLLFEQAKATGARRVAIADPGALASLNAPPPKGCEVGKGPEAIVELACHPEVGTVVAAIVGAAGMRSTLAAAESGKRLALANKESLVVAGALVTEAIRRSNGELIPVDSEHSAIFQALHAGRREDVRRVILTASGGPFRTWSKKQIEAASVEDALAHPTWQMGRKITVDSATMMNKALEIVEAKWLFDLSADQIEIVVHPQSIVHSMVEFVDGSVIAQLSPPDMKLPIQYALTYPERKPCPCPKLDWMDTVTLEFCPVDHDRFPAIELGWQIARRGGSSGAVVNAANEVAVQAFLQGRLKFHEIVAASQAVLQAHDFEPNPTLEDLLRHDRWARRETEKWISTR